MVDQIWQCIPSFFFFIIVAVRHLEFVGGEFVPHEKSAW